MNIYKEFERLINFGLKHELFEKEDIIGFYQFSDI